MASEWVTDWDGIGTDLVELSKSDVPPYLWAKRLRARRDVRVVRCRDCRYREEFRDRHVCMRPVGDDGSWAIVSDDSFCSEGRRPEVRPGGWEAEAHGDQEG